MEGGNQTAGGETTARKKPAVVPTAGQRIGELASEGRGQESGLAPP